MTTSNPFQTPNSEITIEQSMEAYKPTCFQIHGRIGRLRYLAYSFMGYCLPSGLFGALSGVLSRMNSQVVDGLLIAILVFMYVMMFAFMFVIAKRRLNDLGKTGWLSILLIIPIVGFFIWLWLVFSRGDEASNEYGPRPSENTLGIKIAAFIFPIITVTGILAAIAIPAYADYVQRADAAAEAARARVYAQ